MSEIRKHDGYVYVIIKKDWYDYDDVPPMEQNILAVRDEYLAKRIVEEKTEKEYLQDDMGNGYHFEYRYEKIIVLKE